MGPLRGLNEDENPHSLEQGELVQAMNIAKRGVSVGTRPGTRRPSDEFVTAITDALPVQGLVEYRQDFDTGRRLIALANHTTGDTNFLHYNSNSRITTAAVTLTAANANQWVFAEFRNRLYGAGGPRAAVAGNDNFWHWDGNVANPITALAITAGAADAGNGLRPMVVFGFRNYLLVNGLRGGTLAGDNPSCTRYCDFGTDPTVAANWNSGNTLGYSATRPGVDSFGATFTTGMAQYADNEGSWLIVLTNKALFSYQLNVASDFIFSDSVSNGCVHQLAFVSLGVDSGDAVYVSEYGIHSLRQSQAHGAKANEFLSWKIRRTFSTLNVSRSQQIVGAYDHVNGFVVFAIPTGSSTVNDTLLVLDVQGGSGNREPLTAESATWYVWRMTGFSISQLFYGRDTTGAPRLYFGTTTGDIGHFTRSLYSDLAAAYDCRLQTRHDALGSVALEKTLGDTYVTITPGASYSVQYRTIFDYGLRTKPVESLRLPTGGVVLTLPFILPAIIGGAETTGDSKLYGTGSGQTISHEISHFAAEEPFFVSGIETEVEVSAHETGDQRAA